MAATAEPASSLRRALALIRALAGDEAVAAGGLGVTRLAEITGADKSRVSRALQLLADEGFVERSGETRAYRLGWQVYAMAARSGDLRHAGRRAAPPRASDRALQRALLPQRAPRRRPHHRALALAGAVARDRILGGRARAAALRGRGRALLMGMPDETIRALLGPGPYPAFGPRAPRAFGELIERLEVERAQGWVLVDEEFEAGRVGVAAPVRDFRGETVAALNVSAPKFRFEIAPGDAGAVLVEAAADLSRDLGAPAGSGMTQPLAVEFFADGHRLDGDLHLPEPATRRRPC